MNFSFKRLWALLRKEWIQVRRDAMTLRVSDQTLGRPKTHGLRIEQRHQKCCGVVHLDPGRAVDEVGEGDRVRLGEAEVREGR